MYFCLEGLVSIGYFFGSRQSTKNEFRAVKKFAHEFIICDHFVVNNMRCEFVYMCIKPVKCFALTKKYLLKNIFQKYPEIANEIKANSHMRYQKFLKKPIKEQFAIDIAMKNKKSSYKLVSFEEKSAQQEKSKKAKLHKPASPKDALSQENILDRNRREAKKND